MSNALIPVDQISVMASAVAKSGLFGVKTADQAMALMLIAQAEGMHPAIAARDYHVIQGRPALKTDAMLARFQQAGGKVFWDCYTDTEVTGTFSHPAGGSISITWTIEQAKKIGLAGKDNWRNYPRAMLRARCISEGIRTVYPGCVVGTYSVEEVQDFDDSPQKPQKAAKRAVEVSDVSEAVLTTEKPVEEVLDVAEGHPLMVPGLDAPFSHHTTVEAWISGYAALVKRIVNSSKVSDEVKTDKQKDLELVNKSFIASMNAMDRTKLRAALAEAGAVSFPKGSAAETLEEERLLADQQDQIEE
jgi:hypothetical protein